MKGSTGLLRQVVVDPSLPGTTRLLGGFAVRTQMDVGNGVLSMLNGDLVVLGLVITPGHPDDVTLGPLMRHEIHEGAIDGNEIYLGGSMGIRKFKRVGS